MHAREHLYARVDVAPERSEGAIPSKAARGGGWRGGWVTLSLLFFSFLGVHARLGASNFFKVYVLVYPTNGRAEEAKNATRTRLWRTGDRQENVSGQKNLKNKFSFNLKIARKEKSYFLVYV